VGERDIHRAVHPFLQHFDDAFHAVDEGGGWSAKAVKVRTRLVVS
jgi:hypothetical protein